MHGGYMWKLDEEGDKNATLPPNKCFLTEQQAFEYINQLINNGYSWELKKRESFTQVVWQVKVTGVVTKVSSFTFPSIDYKEPNTLMPQSQSPTVSISEAIKLCLEIEGEMTIEEIITSLPNYTCRELPQGSKAYSLVRNLISVLITSGCVYEAQVKRYAIVGRNNTYPQTSRSSINVKEPLPSQPPKRQIDLE